MEAVNNTGLNKIPLQRDWFVGKGDKQKGKRYFKTTVCADCFLVRVFESLLSGPIGLIVISFVARVKTLSPSFCTKFKYRTINNRPKENKLSR
jgi:hypothetical protein